jgi:DNA-binding transcriptional ArsR family regulator
MTTAIDFAGVAALLGDPARANILLALGDGRAQPASELAYAAHVSPQTTSGHLATLTEARLIEVRQQGRHRYYRIASPLVGHLLEAVMAVAADGPPRRRPPSRIGEALRRGRTCYDHLAGRLGVGLADGLVARGHIVFDEDGGEVAPSGHDFFAELGIDLAAAAKRKRAFCLPCIDWSERRPHLAGALGAALAEGCFALGWIARVKDSRAVAITREGERAFAEKFGLVLTEAVAA